MKFCECGCGAQVKKRFVKGHQWRKPAPGYYGGPAFGGPINYVSAPEPPKHIPPPHPAPFDHRLFRLAVEPPGTVMTDPWQGVPCSECRDECFTREKNAEYGKVICEECLWRLQEDLGTATVQQMNRTRAPYNPFE